MDENKIFVISVEGLFSNENQKDKSITKAILADKKTSAWNVCHVFSVITVCVVFSVPISLIPRTNSIFYQSNWYEFNFVMMAIILSLAASHHLNMATYFKKKSFLSFQMLFRTYSLLMVTWTIPSLIAYMIWCQHFNYNWPVPFLVLRSLRSQPSFNMDIVSP